MASTFKEGKRGFYFAGSDGRWKDLLTDADLALYETARRRVLTPECADFLEHGKLALT